MAGYYPSDILSSEGGARVKFVIFANRAANLDAEKTKDAFRNLGYQVEIVRCDGDPCAVLRMEAIESPAYNLAAEGVPA